MIEIKVQNCSKNDLPTYATHGSSGFDLRADVPRVTVLPPGERAVIPTGLHFEIPEGYELQVRSRSGLAVKNGIFVLNSPGTVDSDYRDEVCVILCNLGDQNFEIKPGDRIAQGVIVGVEKASLIEVSEVSREEDRGGGFGSTGIE